MKKALTVIVVSVIISGIVLLGFTAWASAQGNDLIFACVAKDGTVRIVALQGQCKDKETPLTWNIQGEPGPQGDPGPQGPAGVLVLYQSIAGVNIPAFSVGFGATPRCYAGDIVTGGGYQLLDPVSKDQIGFSNISALHNHPVDPTSGQGEGWEVEMWNNSSITAYLEVTAICADIAP